MKILNADKHKFIPQQMLIEQIKYGNGVIKGGAFYLPEYKGDGIKKLLSTAAGVVGTIADVVSGGAKIVKSLTGGSKGSCINGGGIEADALNDIFLLKPAQVFILLTVKNEINI